MIDGLNFHGLYLQPTPQRIRPEHAQTLEKYAWESSEDNTIGNWLEKVTSDIT